MAEEAARRCFRDSLISKAVRAECGKNNGQAPFAQSQFMSSMDPNSYHVQKKSRIRNSYNNSGNSNSMDDSSSTEEASLSNDMDSLHSNLPRYPMTNIPEQDLTAMETSYAQILQSNSEFIEPGSTSGPLKPRMDYTRWLSSRTSALPLEYQFLNRLNPSEFQGDQTVSNSSNKLDIRINLQHGFNNQTVLQESSSNFGYTNRSFTGPLMSPSTLLDAGNTPLQGYHNMNAQPGQQFTPGLISPNNPANSTSPALATSANPTAVRLHELYEVPSPRMVLWDFHDQD